MSIVVKEGQNRSAQVREKLDFPIIDTDFHTIEFEPLFLDYLNQVGGPEIVERYKEVRKAARTAWYNQSWEERRATRTARPPWWTVPTFDALDLATFALPKLLHERLEEIGTDYAVLYPNLGLFVASIEDDELRRASVRALNIYSAEVYGEYSDRMTPVAVIPLHTPEEGIEELEYAVNTLGLKAILIAGYVRRPISAIVDKYPELAREAYWLDFFGIDSQYDYDPFWAKCVELKVNPTLHTAGMGWSSRRSISNYTFNHIGHFASASEALAKSLFLGGVTRRFPTLKFAFIEGLKELYRQYGDERITSHLDQIGNGLGVINNHQQEAEDTLDDFAALNITKAEDIRDLFVNNFYFGIEGDDPTIASAFNRKELPFGEPLKAFLASDAGHWDVPVISEVVADIHSLVDQGRLSPEDFKSFVFANPAKLYAESNPDFFKGTVVEKDVEKLLNRGK
jgi:predicted TIM-barrel fold metal-dependent hydrolase